jgi:hypothetical protein
MGLASTETPSRPNGAEVERGRDEVREKTASQGVKRSRPRSGCSGRAQTREIRRRLRSWIRPPSHGAVWDPCRFFWTVPRRRPFSASEKGGRGVSGPGKAGGSPMWERLPGSSCRPRSSLLPGFTGSGRRRVPSSPLPGTIRPPSCPHPLPGSSADSLSGTTTLRMLHGLDFPWLGSFSQRWS